MTDVVSAAGAVSAALVTGKMTESQLRWSRRHASGTALIHALLPISRLLQQRDIATDTTTWATAVINCMATAQAERSAMNRPDFRSVLQVRMEHDEQEVFPGDA